MAGREGAEGALAFLAVCLVLAILLCVGGRVVDEKEDGDDGGEVVWCCG